MSSGAEGNLAVDRNILADAYTSDETSALLYALCDEIGPRFAGTAGERLGAELIAARMRQYGLDEVRIEEFAFEKWMRGEPAGLTVLGDRSRSIPCLSLPYGCASPTGGVEGELVDIGPGAAKEIERLGETLRGRIVLTDASAAHRGEIYGRVAKAGAKAFVMAARVPGMILPTGCVSFGSIGTIPAVGVAYEAGLLLQRLSTAGGVTVRIATHDRVEAGTSRNVVGVLRGTESPDELALVGGHLDSHDVAPGAVDNASGTVCVVEAARLLARQRGSLRRSVRFVAFGAEEVGLLGSYEYTRAHAAEMPRIRLMLNLDCLVMSRPKGLVFHLVPGAREYVAALREELREPLPYFERVHAHSDHFPFLLKGVPTAEIGGGPFDPGVRAFGHMAGDTVDKVSTADLREESALVARVLFRAASDPGWPLATRSPEQVAALLEETGIAQALAFERGSPRP